jgi:hypothetical protein
VVNVERSPFASTLVALLASDSTYVVGPCIGPGGRETLPFGDDEASRLWQDDQWIAPDLMTKYPMLKTPFIGEIFCRLCYLDGKIPPYSLPSADPGREIPDILIATTASLEEKLWTEAKWLEAISGLMRQGFSVGLLGAKPSVQNQHWRGSSSENVFVEKLELIDLRGAFSLPQVVGAIDRCRLVLSLDNGIMHLALAENKPTVALFRPGIHRLWAPPVDCLHTVIPKKGDVVSRIEVETVLREVALAL